MIPSEIDDAIDQQAPGDREESVTEVPHIPINIRKKKYERTIDDYLQDKIDEDELEKEIWDALRGRLGYYEAIDSMFADANFNTWVPEGSTMMYFGVELEEGRPILLEEIPDVEETLEIVE